MGDEQGHHLSCWAKGPGTSWSRPSRRAGSPAFGAQLQQEASGASFTPGQRRWGSKPWGTESLLHERSGGRTWFIHSSLVLFKEETQELKERD